MSEKTNLRIIIRIIYCNLSFAEYMLDFTNDMELKEASDMQVFHERVMALRLTRVVIEG